jgi:hypothetical protein
VRDIHRVTSNEPGPDIDRYLQRLTDVLEQAHRNAVSEGDSIRNGAEDPRPLLTKIAFELRNLHPELEFLAGRAEFLAMEWEPGA